MFSLGQLDGDRDASATNKTNPTFDSIIDTLNPCHFEPIKKVDFETCRCNCAGLVGGDVCC